jgi:peptidoglycan/LPS O-acetylase OafA/YrhL
MASSKHLPALDGIRGIAVLLVVIYHFAGGAQSTNLLVHSLGLLVQAGWSGVTLFFILSGFLITGILWDTRNAEHWWRNFYIRRTLRIFPLYYATLFVVFLTAVFAHNGLFSLSRLWIYVLFLQDIPAFFTRAADFGSPLWLSHFWSLAIEEQFYLVWPLLLTRMKTVRQAQHLCIAVFFLSALFRLAIWLFSADPSQYSIFLFTRAGELAAGGYLAMCFRDQQWSRLQRKATLTTLLSLAGFLSVCAVIRSFALKGALSLVLGLPCITIFFAGVLVLSLGDGFVSRVARMSWLRWFGGISYGLYVIHQLLNPIYFALAEAIAPHASHNVSRGIIFILGTTISIGLAWLSLRFFETPFLKLRTRFKSETVRV